MKKFMSLILFSLTACASPPPSPSSKIMVHEETTNLLDDCTKLGYVRASTFKNVKNSPELRQEAYRKYKADTVVFINMSLYEGGFARDEWIVNGIAYNCFNDENFFKDELVEKQKVQKKVRPRESYQERKKRLKAESK